MPTPATWPELIMRTLKNTARWPAAKPKPDRLRTLRQRLLREWTLRNPEIQEGPWGRLVTLTAGEAEALAWQTPAPLLVFPALLEEKLDHLRAYAKRQVA